MYPSKISALVSIAICLNIPAVSAGTPSFVLCGADCGHAAFYVGYNRTNLATLDRASSSLPNQKNNIFLHTADLKKSALLPNISEQSIDLENGTYVSSIHRLDGVRVGFVRKSELTHILHQNYISSWINSNFKFKEASSSRLRSISSNNWLKTI